VAAGILVDTNVLVYAHDPAEPRRQAKAIDLLAALVDTRVGRLPVQALSEFFWTVTRTRRPLLTAAEAEAQVDRFAASWPVLDLTPAIVLEAVRGAREHRFSYWDAQIWASARLNQISLVISEDFSHGSRIDGVRFANPFRPGVTIDDLLTRH
jgi:predicted nucleic acid-binding protein